jgi:hypothetical protein
MLTHCILVKQKKSVLILNRSCFLFHLPFLDLKVDQALPLDNLIKRDESLKKILRGLHCKKWVFTNAYKLVNNVT